MHFFNNPHLFCPPLIVVTFGGVFFLGSSLIGMFHSQPLPPFLKQRIRYHQPPLPPTDSLAAWVCV